MTDRHTQTDTTNVLPHQIHGSKNFSDRHKRRPPINKSFKAQAKVSPLDR